MKRCLVGTVVLLTACLQLAAVGAAQPEVVEENPLVPLWRDARWVQDFLNFDSGITPRLGSEEQAVYQALEKDEALADKPLEKAEQLAAKAGGASSALLSYVVANLYLRGGDTTNAVRQLEVATSKNDRFLKAHRTLGLLLARDGKYAEAKSSLARTITLGGGDGLVMGMLGYCLLNEDNFLSARVAYEQAVLLDSRNVEWRLGLIKCYVGLSEYASAASLLDELLVQHPDRAALWVLQANVYVQLEQPQKAIVNLEVLRRMGEAKPQQLGLLADLYMAEGATELALPIYLAMVDAEGGQDMRRGIRAVEILAGRGAWVEAESLLERVKGVSGSGADDEEAAAVMKLEARVLGGLGRGGESIALLEKVLELDPLDGDALLMAGDHYAATEELEKAEIRFDRASKVEGFSADAWVKQAQLRVRDKRYAEAVELLRKAQKLRPKTSVQSFLERVEVAAQRAGG
ncbi:MAG: hypothetical protein RI897_1844 [Verrucomicrobiota bacterium]